MNAISLAASYPGTLYLANTSKSLLKQCCDKCLICQGKKIPYKCTMNQDRKESVKLKFCMYIIGNHGGTEILNIVNHRKITIRYN